jgi:hypothetical protein
MASNPLVNLDWKRWFDRMLPQTLQIALWLLYIDGAFALLDYLDGGGGVFGWSRMRGGLGGLLAPAAIVAHALGGLMIANGRRAGWYLAIFASFSPGLLRALIALNSNGGLGLSWILTQDNFIAFVFEAALVALLIHPMSRNHARRWLR